MKLRLSTPENSVFQGNVSNGGEKVVLLETIALGLTTFCPKKGVTQTTDRVSQPPIAGTSHQLLDLLQPTVPTLKDSDPRAEGYNPHKQWPTGTGTV